MQPARRITRQRRLILDELRGLRTHPTADELYERLRVSLPHLSLGTVYRNLQLLADEGRVRILPEPGGRKRFDADLRDHAHVRCLGCGRVADLPEGSVAEVRHGLAVHGTFRLLGYRVDFVGLCPDCERKGLNPTEYFDFPGEYKTLEGGTGDTRTRPGA